MQKIEQYKTVFQKSGAVGDLMPCYLWTDISDSMKSDGLVEDYVDDATGIKWQRLTVSGLKAKQLEASQGASGIVTASKS